MSVFHDQALFMKATEQEPDAKLYRELVKEEVEKELRESWYKFMQFRSYENEAMVADSIMDSIYVLAGMANSLWGPDKSLTMFKEVHRSNMSKVVPVETLGGVKYAVKRRDDGKILKPASFSPPNLFQIITGVS